MSNSSLNAQAALHIVLQALSPFDFVGIEWRRDSRGAEVVIQTQSPDQRVAVAERLGLGSAEISGDGSHAYNRGAYADVPVKVYSGPSYDEISAWALARAAS